LALRIERWLGVKRGGRAAVWLAQQTDDDLWQAEQPHRQELAEVRHFESAELDAAQAVG